jgi:hypothetical protein
MRTTLILLLLVCVAANEPALARDETSRDEIEFLLRHVENSSVRFVRGGKEYSPKEAADHLRYKLAHAGGRVKTAEDFIAGIATKSYLTGRAYQVKMRDGSLRPSGEWLREALARRRAQPQRL